MTSLDRAFDSHNHELRKEQTPCCVSRKARLAAHVIRGFFAEKLEVLPLFYSPMEWKGRGEAHGANGELIFVHEEDYQYERDPLISEELNARLRPLGLYSEFGTHWYSILYRVDQ